MHQHQCTYWYIAPLPMLASVPVAPEGAGADKADPYLWHLRAGCCARSVPACPLYACRAPSAPSIPDRHQSYGYEEGRAGDLVMQPPPDPVHTGAPNSDCTSKTGHLPFIFLVLAVLY